ncbi:MAG: hypothetical protein V3V92_00460 [Candidatus Hydrothermarchaeales archaeon]
MTFSWMKAWLAGLSVGGILFLFADEWVMTRLIQVLPKVDPSFTGIFLKNSLASFSTIYLGLAICYLELKVYTGVSDEKYDFLERLTDPLYRLIGTIDSTFAELKPFFRSCFFYLLFVPSLSLFMNGLIPGFMIFLEPKLLLPHGLVEIPAMLASAKIAFAIKDEMEGPIRKADMKLLKERMRAGISRGRITEVMLVQFWLLMAAYVEVNYAF